MSSFLSYLNETNLDKLAVGQKVYIGDKEAEVLSVGDDGKVKVSQVPIADGDYDCYVVIRQIKPISFLLSE